MSDDDGASVTRSARCARIVWKHLGEAFRAAIELEQEEDAIPDDPREARDAWRALALRLGQAGESLEAFCSHTGLTPKLPRYWVRPNPHEYGD